MRRRKNDVQIAFIIILVLLICGVCFVINAVTPNRQPTPAPLPDNIVRNCIDFATQAEAQQWWEANGRPVNLDRDGNGVPCEALP